MPIEVKYLDGGKGTFFDGKGDITGEDIIGANKEIFSSEEKIRRYKYTLLDLTRMDDFDVSTPDIEEIARINIGAAEIIPDFVVAIAAQRDIIFGLSRMWQTLVDSTTWETKVFRTAGEAEAWIKERVKARFGIDVTVT